MGKSLRLSLPRYAASEPLPSRAHAIALWMAHTTDEDRVTDFDNLVGADGVDGDEAWGPRPTWRSRLPRIIGWLLFVGAVVGTLALGSLPSPYAVERPGPVYDTLGQVGGKELVGITGATTYPTSGSLDLLTVYVDGTPQNPATWQQVAEAWFTPSNAIVPLDEIYPPQQTDDQASQQSAAEMTDSQQEAVAAALGLLGTPFGTTTTVSTIVTGAPADGVLQVGDVLQSVNGTPASDLGTFRSALAKNGTSKPAQVGILRGGKPMTFPLTPYYDQSTGLYLLGVGVTLTFQFPFTVDFGLDGVGGPSGGMMLALSVYDKLTPGELTGGAQIAGTGTIDETGVVGAIGGIRQKMYAARDGGATWFLAPDSNCDEVTGHIPSGLTVFSVTTLAQALGDVQAIAAGNTSGLAQCPAN